MAGRLDMPMVVVNAFLRGSSWYFPDAVTPAPPPPHPEVDFLASRGARVIPVGGGHGSMFEDPRVIQKISVALQE